MSGSLIENALGHPAKIRILRTLHKPGAGYMSLNQLAKATSLNVMTLSRTLKGLQELGLANYVKAGTSQLWRLSEGYASNVIGPVLDAIEAAPSLLDQLQELVSNFQVPSGIEKIILYGSVARNEHQAGSDIDLFILWSKFSYYDHLSFDKLTEKISKRFWMTPSCLHKTPSEFKKMSPELKRNINEGIVLYEKNKDERGPKDGSSRLP